MTLISTVLLEMVGMPSNFISGQITVCTTIKSNIYCFYFVNILKEAYSNTLFTWNLALKLLSTEFLK